MWAWPRSSTSSIPPTMCLPSGGSACLCQLNPRPVPRPACRRDWRCRGKSSVMRASTSSTQRRRPTSSTFNGIFQPTVGDYTRSGIDVRTRELVTFSMLVALGGCEPQVKGHVAPNLPRRQRSPRLIDVLTQLLPFIGYPRTLNGLKAIDEVAPALTRRRGVSTTQLGHKRNTMKQVVVVRPRGAVCALGARRGVQLCVQPRQAEKARERSGKQCARRHARRGYARCGRVITRRPLAAHGRRAQTGRRPFKQSDRDLLGADGCRQYPPAHWPYRLRRRGAGEESAESQSRLRLQHGAERSVFRSLQGQAESQAAESCLFIAEMTRRAKTLLQR
jgi:alkylhydroperoxidase/carboxymuconolactone decarboxylase family protein YurZ